MITTVNDCSKPLQRVLYEVLVIRLILITILYFANINSWLKIALILLLDGVKGHYIRMRCSKYMSFAHVSLYHNIDKVLDYLGYVVIMMIIQQQQLLTSTQRTILMISLIYRGIGNLLFFLTKDRTKLFWFVDVFKEYLLFFIINTYYVKCFNQFVDTVVLLVITAIKMNLEYNLHVKQKHINVNDSSASCHKDCDHNLD
jgi:hypothetical protein